MQNFLKGRAPVKTISTQLPSKPAAAPAPKLPETPKPPSAILVQIAKVRTQVKNIFNGVASKLALKFNSSQEDAKLAIGATVTILVLTILGGGVIARELLQPDTVPKPTPTQVKKKPPVAKKVLQANSESTKPVTKEETKIPEAPATTTPVPVSPAETPNSEKPAIIEITPKSVLVRSDEYLKDPSVINKRIDQYNEQEAIKDAAWQRHIETLENARKAESQTKEAKKE